MPSVVNLDADQVRSLARIAIASGADRVGVTRVQWDVSSGCLDPVEIDIFGRPLDIGPASRSRHTWRIFLIAKCRKCPVCLRRRAWLWRERMVAETRAASRTWFCTLTLSPEMQMRAHHLAIRYCRQARCSDFESETPSQQYSLRHRIISKWLTLWLKRVRKNSGVKLRYIIVAEAHKSGLPHYHALVHQCHPDGPVKYRHLDSAYDLGFSKFNLVPKDDVRKNSAYVAKYLAKSSIARVRASIRYGSCEPTWRPEDLGDLQVPVNPQPPRTAGEVGLLPREDGNRNVTLSSIGAGSGPEAAAEAVSASAAAAHAEQASGSEARETGVATPSRTQSVPWPVRPQGAGPPWAGP